MIKVSIIIPAYNEERFIGALLERVLTVPTEEIGFTMEIIVIDDGSQDRTYEIASRFNKVRCFKQKTNQGKGKAVQRGVEEAKGDFVLVQDGDLEYDPFDYLPILEATEGKRNIAIYGSRTKGNMLNGWLNCFPGKHKNQGFGPWVAGNILTLWVYFLYRQWITDTLTGYKLYPTKTIKDLTIKTNGFETDHEITAKLIRKKIMIKEVPISYSPRSREEGKKIRAKDGIIALWTLLKFRFYD